MRNVMSKTNRLLTITNVLLALILMLVLVQFSPTVANANSSSVVACANKKSGALRMAYKKCKKSENKVSWGIQGTAGATGPQGPAGLDRSGYPVFKDSTGATINNIVTVGNDGSIYKIVDGLMWGFHALNGSPFGPAQVTKMFTSANCVGAYVYPVAGGTNNWISASTVFEVLNPATGGSTSEFYKAQSLVPIASTVYFQDSDGDCSRDSTGTHYLPLTRTTPPASIPGPFSISFN